MIVPVPVLRPVAMVWPGAMVMPVAVLGPVIVVIGVAVASGAGGRIAHDPQHGGQQLVTAPRPQRRAGDQVAAIRPAPRAVPVASDFQSGTLARQLLRMKERR